MHGVARRRPRSLRAVRLPGFWSSPARYVGRHPPQPGSSDKRLELVHSRHCAAQVENRSRETHPCQRDEHAVNGRFDGGLRAVFHRGRQIGSLEEFDLGYPGSKRRQQARGVSNGHRKATAERWLERRVRGGIDGITKKCYPFDCPCLNGFQS